MKSILVIDTPKTCKECPCQMMLVCVPADEDIDEYVDPNTTMPEWCPLRPLPEVRDTHCHYDNWELDRIINSQNRGWNWCIDEIMGEKE